MLIKNSDLYLSILFIIVSIYMFVETFQMPEVDGEFPLLISIVLFIFSVALLIKTIKNKESENSLQVNILRKVCLLIVLMVIYVLIVGILGYLISSILLFICTFLIMGYRKIMLGIISAIIIVPIVFVIFKVFLNVPLPQAF